MMLLLSQQLEISLLIRGGEGKGKRVDEPRKRGTIFYHTLIKCCFSIKILLNNLNS
jgi:hypothetical protein